MKSTTDDFSAVVLADLHFGSKQDCAHIYESCVRVVYPYIIKTLPDMIVIAGDDTDDRMSLDQTASKYYLKFIHDITHFKKNSSTPIAVRFISGTESHQKNQLSALEFVVSDIALDVKVYETVSEENFHGKNILYIPEESVIDKNAHYADTLYRPNARYDYCFGHGLFSFVSFIPGQYVERSLRGSPTFTYDEFRSVVSQCVVFGHIHIAQNYKNFIYYPGSLDRFRQGEDESKGFISIYNSNVTFIENPFARKYLTITIPKSRHSNTLEELQSWIINIVKQDNSIHQLRVMLDRVLFEPSLIEALKGYFVKHPEHKTKITLLKEGTNDVANSYSAGVPEENRALSNRFPEIRNPEDWIFNSQYFAREAFGKELSKERIESILEKAKAFDEGKPL